MDCDEMEPLKLSRVGEEQSRLTKAPQIKSCQYSKDFWGGTSFVECVIAAMTADIALIDPGQAYDQSGSGVNRMQPSPGTP